MSAFANPNPNKSLEVAQPPSDSVSSLSFSPKANHLVATSWDNQVRCWEIMQNAGNVASTPKASISHDQPVLCSAWKDDGTTVFSGGCDKQVKMWPLLSGGQAMTVAMHEAPVKEVAWIPEMSLLVSGSWDKTLKYWDTRQPNPVHTQQLPDRCYSMTVRYPLMVVGTADRNLCPSSFLFNPPPYTSSFSIPFLPDFSPLTPSLPSSWIYPAAVFYRHCGALSCCFSSEFRGVDDLGVGNGRRGISGNLF